jgi:DNA-binding protein HU-beta
MTKAEIIAEMADKGKITKAAAERALDAFVDAAKKTLRNEGRFAVSGLGSFVVTERKARMVRNPQTGAPISIPASKGVRFKPGKSLKSAM